MQNEANHASYIAKDGEYVCVCCNHWKRKRTSALAWGWTAGIWTVLVLQLLIKAFI
jgi:hypothetical protein